MQANLSELCIVITSHTQLDRHQASIEDDRPTGTYGIILYKHEAPASAQHCLISTPVSEVHA